MYRSNFFDLLMVKASLPEKKIISLGEHFTQFSRYVLSDGEKEKLFTSRLLAATPIAKLYEHLVESHNSEGLANNFTLFSLKGIKENIPEVLEYRHICYDTLQMENALPKISTILKVYPELNKKLLMNVSSLIKDSPSGPVLRDSTTFQSLVVRDVLCRSFYQSGSRLNWITPAVDQHIAKIYGLLVSSAISKHFSLDQNVQKLVALVFILYMLGQMSNPEMAKSTVGVKAKYYYFGSTHEVEEYISKIEQLSGKSTVATFDDAIEIVNSLGIARLHISRQHLGMKLKSISSDPLSSVFSLEYPPYFLWSALMSISGAKTGLSFFLKQQGLHKDLLLASQEICRSQAVNLLQYYFH